ncbi:MAG: magnesium/cobalt transporter CorA [Chitinophagaceae bacterium]|nr:magnesium/cobalt transporter CorA [Chitinophagaceae bacterium]
MASKRQKVSKYLPTISLNKKKRVTYDPAAIPEVRTTKVEALYSVFNYDEKQLNEYQSKMMLDWKETSTNYTNTWINADGLRKEEVENICAFFNIHPLLTEDILSIGQRAKMDEVEDKLSCLLPMIFFNNENTSIELEQVSIVFGSDFLLSFQEDATRDVFDPLRARLRNTNQRIRERGTDYLCYSLLDVIVDSYFGIIEKLYKKIEEIEEKLLRKNEQGLLKDISHMRKEVMAMKQAIAPVRELVAGFLRSNNKLIEARNEKYFKDVLDHITQAHDDCESLKDMLSNLQDMYMNNINIRMNEVMKIFTIVSLLLAPATVIGGIFGMNFGRIPLLHDQRGFYISVAAMLLIPMIMIIIFKRQKWL